MKFLEISRISFISQLGGKSKEGFVRKRSGDTSTTKFADCAQDLPGYCCCCCYILCQRYAKFNLTCGLISQSLPQAQHDQNWNLICKFIVIIFFKVFFLFPCTAVNNHWPSGMCGGCLSRTLSSLTCVQTAVRLAASCSWIKISRSASGPSVSVPRTAAW